MAGFTRDAQRVPNDRRRSWALANFPAALLTTTPAFLPMAEMVRLIRFRVTGSPGIEAGDLEHRADPLLRRGF